MRDPGAFLIEKKQGFTGGAADGNEVRSPSSATALGGRSNSPRTERRIRQSILAKAFQGELVPTEAELAEGEGRSFESAEELLKRINTNPQRTGADSKGIKPHIPHPRRSKGRNHSGSPR